MWTVPCGPFAALTRRRFLVWPGAVCLLASLGPHAIVILAFKSCSTRTTTSALTSRFQNEPLSPTDCLSLNSSCHTGRPFYHPSIHPSMPSSSPFRFPKWLPYIIRRACSRFTSLCLSQSLGSPLRWVGRGASHTTLRRGTVSDQWHVTPDQLQSASCSVPWATPGSVPRRPTKDVTWVQSRRLSNQSHAHVTSSEEAPLPTHRKRHT
ncbi:hypothetical protein EV126DRAFT_249856 [Verticillium dahliae]|nr:hypothetical protein EV126DRAFT_249856 [Verticillium dahliae]